MKGGSGMDAKAVLRHFGVDPREVTWVDSRGKPPDTERYRVELFGKGELDAVCCDPPHWNHAVQLGGVRLTSARDLWEMPEAGLGTTPEAIARHPDVVQGMVRAALRGAEFARMNREETLDAVLRHNIHVDRALAGQLWDMLHNDWGPVTDLAAYQRKVDLYEAEWNLPKAPLSTYYDFRFLKHAMDDLRLLRTWDPKMDTV
jgi:ABC-type nitrate/sulfonate/bicarbonate transport system substrate-binding protein